MSACKAAGEIAAGKLSSEKLVQSCLERIDAREGAVHAWAHVDHGGAVAAARECDTVKPAGSLHGVPVGIKDVVDVADMPTTYGSPIFSGNIAVSDAACVTRLREDGAVILGKTVTAEFATYSPGPTTNPHSPEHTPGGSSSGSAAAVADYHVPLAIGTQTAGSVIRPASFTGAFGYKPSFERWDKTGCLETSPSLDTLGIFARTLDDITLADVVISGDASRPDLPTRTVVGISQTMTWPHVEQPMRDALFAFARKAASEHVEIRTVILPGIFGQLSNAQALIHRHQAYRSLGHILEENPDQVSAAFRDFVSAGAAHSEDEYLKALLIQAACKDAAKDVFADIDMLLTAGALGAAPEGLTSTGDPAMQRIWTAIGAPSIGFPASHDEHGMPLGLQLVGMPGTDRAFLANAVPILSSITVGEPRP